MSFTPSHQHDLPRPQDDGSQIPFDRREYRRVLISSYIGTAVEYYDFLLYAAAASLIFGELFFSGLSPLAGTVAALGTLAAGYLSRPIGGVVFGHIGDRIGRKKTLTMTMILMGVATSLIGLLPTSAQIGGFAPVLLILLRIVQGIGVGGEWGGATTMCYEHARPGRRAFAASVVNAGMPAGTALAAVLLGLFSLLPDEQFLSWGWRIPFLLSSVLVFVGLWMRLRISESPLFVEAQKKEAESEARGEDRTAPILQVLRRPGMLIAALCTGLAPFALNAFVNTFGLVWASENGGLSSTQTLTAQACGAFVNIFTALTAGYLADRIGHKPIMMFGIIGAALFAYPFLLLLGSGSLGAAIVGNVVAVVFIASFFAPLPSFISGLFPTSTRYTGAGLGYQLASTLAGGFSPMIFSALLAAGGGTDPRYVLMFIAVAAVLGVTAVVRVRKPLPEQETGAERTLVTGPVPSSTG
ncbi:MFS transporter [Streptomyces sp. NPDC052052]|uniref:MFS transporter n=1 Tax=Streptomyces sp. NPDC052052 TaxID=3154756 RepID=UPI003438214A